jgi:hypothetical protein
MSDLTITNIDSGGDVACPKCCTRFDVEHWDNEYDWYDEEVTCPSCDGCLRVKRWHVYEAEEITK